MRKHLLFFLLAGHQPSLSCARWREFCSIRFIRLFTTGDKAALLMVHFGTTHDDTRALTIDADQSKSERSFQRC